MNFAVINAQTVLPKIDSLVENFEERELNFAIVTETWFVHGPLYEQALVDLGAGHNINAVCQNRKATVGRNTAGGVAVFYRRSKVTLKTFPFKRNGCEIVAVKGKMANTTQSIYIIGIYLPPGMTKKTRDKYKESLRDLVNKIKTQDRSPRTGDLNNYNLEPAFLGFPGHQVLGHPCDTGTRVPGQSLYKLLRPFLCHVGLAFPSKSWEGLPLTIYC